MNWKVPTLFNCYFSKDSYLYNTSIYDPYYNKTIQPTICKKNVSYLRFIIYAHNVSGILVAQLRIFLWYAFQNQLFIKFKFMIKI